MIDSDSQYLHNGGPAFVNGTVLSPKDAVRMIREAGGIAVLAHPWCLSKPLQLIESLTNVNMSVQAKAPASTLRNTETENQGGTGTNSLVAGYSAGLHGLQGLECYKDTDKAMMFGAVVSRSRNKKHTTVGTE